MKKPESKTLVDGLFGAMLICFTAVWVIVPLCFWLWFRGDELFFNQPKASGLGFYINGLLYLVQQLAFMIIPCLGFGFLVVGYFIWKHRHNAKNVDSPGNNGMLLVNRATTPEG